MTAETADLLWKVEDRRLDSERVLIRPRTGGFTLEYKPLPGSLWRVGNAQKLLPPDAADWLDAPGRAVFFCWLDGALAGQLCVEGAEHTLAAVRDVRVAMAVRRRGVGEALLGMAEDWARGYGLGGVVCETQDVNAGACQFLTRCGFQLGGVDTLRYVALSHAAMVAAGLRETALFFYRFLR